MYNVKQVWVSRLGTPHTMGVCYGEPSKHQVSIMMTYNLLMLFLLISWSTLKPLNGKVTSFCKILHFNRYIYFDKIDMKSLLIRTWFNCRQVGNRMCNLLSW